MQIYIFTVDLLVSPLAVWSNPSSPKKVFANMVKEATSCIDTWPKQFHDISSVWLFKDKMKVKLIV